MNLNVLFERLWADYSSQNPSVEKISDLFLREGENIVNDHIAFRTLDFKEIDVDAVARPFTDNGYVLKGEYHFKEKHLFAKHFEYPGKPLAPRIFISQLILDDCTYLVKKNLREAFQSVDIKKLSDGDLIFAGRIFKPVSYNIYKMLREDSEYAAWFYAFGFRANHFTVNINSLNRYNDIYKVNNLLKENGFLLNSSGGEVKGTPEELLLQSSTMADHVKVDFIEGSFEIPSCYYEFAQRFHDSEGNLFNGFIAGSADKIFESTNFYQKP